MHAKSPKPRKLRVDHRWFYERFIKSVLAWVNRRGEYPIFPGVLRDGIGRPILKVDSTLPEEDLRPLAAQLFRRLAQGDWQQIEHEANAFGPGSFRYFSSDDAATCAIRVPATSGARLVYDLVMLARCTPTRAGDPVAERITICKQCGDLFLCKTRFPASYCASSCRYRQYNATGRKR